MKILLSDKFKKQIFMILIAFLCVFGFAKTALSFTIQSLDFKNEGFTLSPRTRPLSSGRGFSAECFGFLCIA